MAARNAPHVEEYRDRSVYGIVVETTVGSLTGKYLYSDFSGYDVEFPERYEKTNWLNTVIGTPVIGVAGGIARVALGIIHTVEHLFHVAKGGCEIIRGVIESVPIVGRIFAWAYGFDYPMFLAYKGLHDWWIIKIYNPQEPDGLDRWRDNWKGFPERLYIRA